MTRHFVMANVAAALAQCIFGVGQVIGKLGMSANMSPLLFYLVRVSLSGLLFLIFAAISKAKLRIRGSDIPGFLLVGPASDSYCLITVAVSITAHYFIDVPETAPICVCPGLFAVNMIR